MWSVMGSLKGVWDGEWNIGLYKRWGRGKNHQDLKKVTLIYSKS